MIVNVFQGLLGLSLQIVIGIVNWEADDGQSRIVPRRRRGGAHEEQNVAFPSPSLLNQFGSKTVERLVSRVPTVSRLIKHNIFSPELVLCSRILLNKSCNNHNYRYRMHRIYIIL